MVPYPKIVFLYPTFIAALVATVWMAIVGKSMIGPEDTSVVIITWLFLGVFATNLAVMTFDFPRATSLTMFFLFAAIVLGAILLFTMNPGLLPQITKIVTSIRPVANTTFFAIIVVLLGGMFASVLVSVRFDYWEVRHNELLHHHGVLSDLKRFSSPHLRIDKEINDVFEFLLLGSGRLILQPSNERRAIILDNVLFINKKEAAITQMLGALQVEVRSGEPAEDENA
ncbi:MAG: hypothetical protein FJ297_08980 [Planctomycetes bacterium]|nr:hypothetical protein [Planctomycetota bacterium]